MGIIGDVGTGGGKDVIQYDELERDEIEGGNIPGCDNEEGDEDGDICLWEKDEESACYGCDCAACTEDGNAGSGVEHIVAEGGEDGAGEVEAYVADVAELIVDVVAEEVQEEHVSNDVKEVGMEKGVGDELPKFRVGWPEHEIIYDGFGGAGLKGIGENEYDYI